MIWFSPFLQLILLFFNSIVVLSDVNMKNVIKMFECNAQEDPNTGVLPVCTADQSVKQSLLNEGS